MTMISGGGGFRSSGSFNNNFNNSNNTSGGDVVGGGIVLGALGGAGWSLFALGGFVSAAMAVAVGGGCIVALLAMGFAAEKEFDNKGLSCTALGFSVVAALLIAPVCFVYHAAPFPIVAWAAEGLYALGLLSGALAQLNGFMKLLSLLTGVAAATALAVLPTPKGAEKPGEDERTWKINVTTLTSEGEPVRDAWAQCTSIMRWEQDQPFKMEGDLGALTDEKGKAEFKFNDDTRMKVAVCGATKPARDDAPGYKLSTAFVAAPFRGGTYDVTVELKEQTDERFAVYPAQGAGSGVESVTAPAVTDEIGITPPAVETVAQPFDETLLSASLADAVRAARSSADTARSNAAHADEAEHHAQSDAAVARDWAARATEIAQQAFNGGVGLHYFANNGYSYAGDWRGNTQDGYGVERWDPPATHAGDEYRGGFRSGERSDFGVMTYQDRDPSNGKTDYYAGGWRNGQHAGYGKMAWLGGNYYAGAFSNGRMGGLGVYHYDSGTIYRGAYDKGREGYGVMTLEGGDVFYGVFANGERNGYGVYEFTSGQRYEGQWSNSKREGLGVQWGADGRVVRAGVWSAGELVEAQ